MTGVRKRKINREIKKVGKNARTNKASFWLKSQNRAEE